MERKFAVVAVVEALIIAVLAFFLMQSEDGEALPSGEALAGEQRLHPPERMAAARPAAGEAGDSEPAEVTPRAAVATIADSDFGSLLFGLLTANDGDPLEEAYVTARRSGTKRYESGAVQAGRYAFPGMEPGAWEIRARAKGCRDLSVQIDIDGSAPQRHDLTLQRAYSLKVAVVTDDGRPLRAAMAEEEVPFTELIAIATTEEPVNFPMTTLRTLHNIGVGRWRGTHYGQEPLPKRYLGILEIGATPPVWVCVVHRHVVLAKKIVPAGLDEVELIVPMDALFGSFSGARLRVVAAETGTPLTEARVSFSDRQSGGGGIAPDEDGVAVFDRIPSGIMELTIRAEERELYHRMVRLPPGQTLDLGTVAVDAVGTIKGSVVDPDGAAVAGATLRHFRLGRTPADLPLDNGMSANSDAEGKFELWGVGLGRYLVVAYHDTGCARAIVDTSAKAVEDLRMELRDGQIEIINQVPPTETYLLSLRTPDGDRAYSGHVRPGSDYVRSVPPGRYTAEIRNDRGVVRSFEVKVTEGQPAPVTVP